MPAAFSVNTPATAAVSTIEVGFNAGLTNVLFTFYTEVPGKMTVAIQSTQPGVAPVIVTEAAANAGRRTVSLVLPAGAAGWAFSYQMLFAPTDTLLRSYFNDGAFRVGGARTVAKANAVNVRWNAFSWNTYQWAQYNPKNEAKVVFP